MLGIDEGYNNIFGDIMKVTENLDEENNNLQFKRAEERAHKIATEKLNKDMDEFVQRFFAGF